jgi:hypothetical protein
MEVGRADPMGISTALAYLPALLQASRMTDASTPTEKAEAGPVDERGAGEVGTRIDSSHVQGLAARTSFRSAFETRLPTANLQHPKCHTPPCHNQGRSRR